MDDVGWACVLEGQAGNVTCVCNTLVLFGPMFHSAGLSVLMSKVWLTSTGSLLEAVEVPSSAGPFSIGPEVGTPNFCKNCIATSL